MNFKRQTLITACIIFLSTHFTFAQSDYVFEHLSTENGLSHGSVSAMHRDKKGFMWFATWDGLSRYDGVRFKTFKLTNTDNNNSSSNRIAKMVEDAYGNIWIKDYDSKAFRLNYFTEKFEAVPFTLSDSIVPKISRIYTFSSGDVWLASNSDGIYRITTDNNNSTTTSHFNDKSNISIPGNSAYSIYEDAKKNIWINTNNGISCFIADPITGAIKNSAINQSTTSLLNEQAITVITSNGLAVFFGTKKGFLIEYNLTSNTCVKIDLKNKAEISDIAISDSKDLYIGTRGSGLLVYDTEKKIVSNHYTQAIISNILKTHADSRGMVWVESTKAGISKINTHNKSFKHYVQELDVNLDIRSIPQCGLIEDEDYIWVTPKGGGFGYYNYQTDELEYFYNKPGDPQRRVSNFVKCFYKDSSGVLWLSTYFKGIEKITLIKKQFQFFQPASESKFSIANEVRAMLYDSYGYLWVATKNSEIFILDTNFALVKKLDRLIGKEIGLVYALMEDSQGRMYLGTKGNGLFRLTRNKILQFETEHFIHNPDDAFSISSNNIYTLLEDNYNKIWVGTYGGGINILEKGRFTHSENQLNYKVLENSKRVRHIAEDNKGNLWFGTTTGILFLENKNSLPLEDDFSFYNRENGLTKGLLSNDIYWILCDANKQIWMASLGDGLAKLKAYPEKNKLLDFSVLTKADGLPSDAIFTISNDEKGNLWMSTDNGIAFYNPDKHFFKNYSLYDGIVNSAFSEAAIAKQKQGGICLGANNGFYFFTPSEFPHTQNKARLLFTGFQLFGKDINPGDNSVLKHSMTETKSITLKHNQNVFGITWAGLEFNMQDKFQYTYILEGFDSQWQFDNKQNQANYTKIPPGDYTFKIKFANQDLQELNQAKTLAIKIRPPIWKTTLAYLLYIILSLILLESGRRITITIISLRNKVVIEKELTDIKLNFFTNISHELRTPLTLILSPTRELKSEKALSAKSKSYLNLIEQNTQRLLKLVNQLLDFRKIQSKKMNLELREVNIVSFVSELCHNFDEMAEEKNIAFRLTTASDTIPIFIDEQKMDTVIYNLLSNAFKFTPTGESINISISESTNNNKVFIEIVDTGLGIAPEEEESLFDLFWSRPNVRKKEHHGSGIGLALSKELIQLHKGEIIYKATPGGGATFRVVLNRNQYSHDVTNARKKESVNHITIPQQVTLLKNKGEQACLLVVEDNSELRLFLEQEFRDSYMVITAEDGEAGLKKALQSQPDIILSDIMMPKMNGIEMLEQIKNNFETSHIPVVLLSARSSVESKIKGLKYGADAYLTKPFYTDQLKAQIDNLLLQRTKLLNKYAKDESASDTKPDPLLTKRDSDFLEQVRTVIEDNLTNSDFRIDFLYNTIGMGRSKFFNKLKGLIGLSPIDFVKEYRLNKAHTLLLSGEYNVSEASYLSGFTDAGYFGKCFKEKFGINPSEASRLKK